MSEMPTALRVQADTAQATAAWVDTASKLLLVGAAELARMEAEMAFIWKLVHIPTPQGTKAYTHFQRDFDQIRAITKRYVATAESTEQ
jgi:hypothetical protein